MFTRTAGAALGSKLAVHPTKGITVVRSTIGRFLRTTQHALTIVGVSALATVAVLFFKPHLVDQIKQYSPLSSSTVAVEDTESADKLAVMLDGSRKSLVQADDAATHTETVANNPLTDEERKLVGTAAEQKRVTAWIAKRYRVATDATDMLVSAAYLNAKEMKLDPLLILAVMAIESRFNPFAESPVGAQGLMQVMSKIHKDKFEDHGGIKAALNPVANIKVGSMILKEYVRRGGSVEAGLKMYVGAAAMETDYGYGAKVLSEYRRLQMVAAGQNVPAFSTATIKPSQKPAEPAEQKGDVLIEAQTVGNKPV
jgi:soluble lytic murein transglycosylase-like protein